MQDRSLVTVGILSDTHAFLDPRIADLISRCDIAVHAGDICDPGILEQMAPGSGRIVAVAGNNDSDDYPDRNGGRRILPRVATLDLPGGSLVVEHGERHGFRQPSHDSLRRSHARARAIVYGHTHRAIVDRATEPWIINPGAAGRTRTHGGPSCAILSAGSDRWSVCIERFDRLDP